MGTPLTKTEVQNRQQALRAARREERITCRVTGTVFKRGEGRFVSAEGIARLAEAGAQAFSEATEHRLPHNVIRTAMSGAVGVVGPRGCILSKEGAAKQIESHARLGGWLRAAARLPAVRKLIAKTQSERGVNSDYTYLSLWALVRRFPSPGGLERKLWAVKKRTESILSAYEGQKPSWRSLGLAVMADARVGKAAVIAAASGLGWDGGPGCELQEDGKYYYSGLNARARGHGKSSGTYQKARDWLVERRSAAFPVVRENGVRVAAVPIYEKMGVEVSGALRTGQYGQRELLYMVRFGEREFLVGNDEEARFSSPTTGYWTTVLHGPRAAVLHALRAWRTHDRETLPIMKETENMLVEGVEQTYYEHYSEHGRYCVRYRVDLILGDTQGSFQVEMNGPYGLRWGSKYPVLGQDGQCLSEASDGSGNDRLFHVVQAACEGGEVPDGASVIALLGYSEEIMTKLGFRKEAE